MIGAYLLHQFIFKSYEYYQVLLGLFLLGIIMHRLFCVRTTIDKYLFYSYMNKIFYAYNYLNGYYI